MCNLRAAKVAVSLSSGMPSLLAITVILTTNGSLGEVVGEAVSGDEAVSQTAALNPDLVLLDIRMPQGDGLTALNRLKYDRPDLPVLVFSTFDNPTYVARAVALGAAGYVLKGAPSDKLLEAIRSVASGENAWTREELRRVTGALATPRLNADVEVPLTQRESEVLRQVALGFDEQRDRSSAAH